MNYISVKRSVWDVTVKQNMFSLEICIVNFGLTWMQGDPFWMTLNHTPTGRHKALNNQWVNRNKQLKILILKQVLV